MDIPPPIYNQAGPSNYANSYAHNARPQQPHGPGRGRGYNRGGMNGSYQRHQHQQHYPPTGHAPPHSGYSMGMNNINGAGPNGHIHYNPLQNGPPGPATRRPNMGYSLPTSPPIPPAQVYHSHAPPFVPAVPPLPPTALYAYPHTQAPLQPYPPAFMHSPSQPPYPYINQSIMKSPSISPLPEQIFGSANPPKLHSPPPPALRHSISPSQPQPQTEPLKSEVSLQPSVESVSETTVAIEAVASTLSPSTYEVMALSPPPHQPESTLMKESQAPSPPRTPRMPQISLQDNEPAPHQEWVISFSRPDDPADAFGIIISPKAKPPARIVDAAMEYRPPVRSPRLLPKDLKEEPHTSAPLIPSTLQDAQVEPEAEKQEALIEHSPPHTEQVSSSATETESGASTAPDAFVPGSPVSTNTSISLAPPVAIPTNGKDAADLSTQSSALGSPSFVNASLESSIISVSATSSSSAVKKSWASLLRAEGSKASKSSLPTSSVVGFSIPATSEVETSKPHSVSDAKRDDLLRLLTSGPSSSSGVPQIRPRGLVNTGNMCFANAVLQTLVYCPPFYRLFTELGKYISGTGLSSTKWNGKSTPLVEATVEFLKEFKPKSKDELLGDEDDYDGIDSFLPVHVYEAMKEGRLDNMRGGQQEDAEEFFGFFLDTLEEELLAISNTLKPETRLKPEHQEGDTGNEDGWLEVGKKNKAVVARSTKSVDSPITRIFGGKFRSTLKVPGQRDSVLVEAWRSLQLDIQREQVSTIEDALQTISHPQPVQVSSVTKGGAVVDATQQVLVEYLPPILVLHLKRFLYDTTAKGVVKISKQVTFGPELEIPHDAISQTRRTAHPNKYKLFAVLYHHGQSAAGGHYTLDVLHPNRNADLSLKPREGWVRIDDELVSDLRAQDVFRSDVDDRCAYLLFYRRIGGSYARTGQNLA